MMKTTEFTGYLKSMYPSAAFYTGTLDRSNPQCIGVYSKGRIPSTVTIGGAQNASTDTMSLTLLIHWTEDTTECETMANSLYDALFAANDFMIGDRRIVLVDCLDSAPVDVSRDENNIVEMVIRINVIYEREVM